MAATQHAPVASFLRMMAPIYCDKGLLVDVATPVLLKRDAYLGFEVMTMMLIRSRAGARAGNAATYDIRQDHVGLFLANGDNQRRYITLVMELGASNPWTPTDGATLSMDHWTTAYERKRRAGGPPVLQCYRLRLLARDVRLH